ncbi:MAG: glycosyltransferase [Lachnospiraceae bacterium]|nr:glycosyltransferase [Lachnospiraceae bacterium]
MGNLSVNVKKTINYLRENGLKATAIEVQDRLSGKKEVYEPVHPSEAELLKQRRLSGDFPYRPLISVVVPLYNTDERFLKALIECVEAQSYDNWELILADGSEKEGLADVVRTVSENKEHPEGVSAVSINNKVRYHKLDVNYGISGNTNHALEFAKGDYVALLDHDDLLEKNALFEVVSAINRVDADAADHADANGAGHRDAGAADHADADAADRRNAGAARHIDVIYTDEDRCGESGDDFYNPVRKCDFNFEYLLSNNYICHLVVMKASLIKKLELRKEFSGAQDHDLLLRAAVLGSSFYHIPKILYHWRVFGNSTSGNTSGKLYAYEAGKKAAAQALSGILQDTELLSQKDKNAGTASEKVCEAGEYFHVYRTRHVGVYGFDFEKSPMDTEFKAPFGNAGAVGGLVVRKNKEGIIVGGPSDFAGECEYLGKRAAAGGKGNSRFCMREVSGLDLRNICLSKEARGIFKEVVGVSYEDVPLNVKYDLSAGDDISYTKIHDWERIFDVSVLPENADITALSEKLSEALKAAGYKLLYLPSWESVVQ